MQTRAVRSPPPRCDCQRRPYDDGRGPTQLPAVQRRLRAVGNLATSATVLYVSLGARASAPGKVKYGRQPCREVDSPFSNQKFRAALTDIFATKMI